jgi:hypothetical protein
MVPFTLTVSRRRKESNYDKGVLFQKGTIMTTGIIAVIAVMDMVSHLMKLSTVYGVHRLVTRGQPGTHDREVDVKCGDISIHSRVDGD